MSKWLKPEITNLGLSNTAGNPCTTGNDSMIPDCLETMIEHIAGRDTSGDCPKPTPTPNYSL